jgi:hypothetical protein
MAPFPPVSVTIPMGAKDYLLERDNAAYRALVAEVFTMPGFASDMHCLCPEIYNAATSLWPLS